MNQAIGQRLQAQGKLQMSGEWFAGRPVMITENEYGLGLYNGDIGIAASDGERLRVWFVLPDGKAHGFLPSRLPAHDTAWAMTVHKSQGSEFTHTLLLLPPEVNPLLTRELLYTGITRAREQLDLFATPEMLALMVRKQTERYSGLGAMLDTMRTLNAE
jgi:exodeoxyribonuclease V alpha subunit